MADMNEIDVGKAVDRLFVDIGEKKKKEFELITFAEFWDLAVAEPEKIFRSIFQRAGDLVESRVEIKKDNKFKDPESIDFVPIDSHRLLVEGMDQPFYASTLFANHLLDCFRSLRSGAQNKIVVLRGPHGCGKSTFVNNLLKSFEDYANSEDGRCFELFWRLDDRILNNKKSGVVEVVCPSHCHPITIIPKEDRRDFLGSILGNSEIAWKLLGEKEYEWIFEDEPCTICQSILSVLFEKRKDAHHVFNMLCVRPYKYNRRLGQGVSVYNPGDKPSGNNILPNKEMQKKLSELLGDSQRVKYLASRFAGINNGFYVLADVKSHNKGRLIELHNIISEGVHKVGEIEERVDAFFFALTNPGDLKSVKKEVDSFESFKDRFMQINMAYPLDVGTEVNMYLSNLGDQIKYRFLPMVLDNFARIIISTRMRAKSEALAYWIKDLKKYKKHTDPDGYILRMEIATGKKPSWLLKEDDKTFKKDKRRKIVEELRQEGNQGFSCRESLELLKVFLAYFKPDNSEKEKMINMEDLYEFLEKKLSTEEKRIPKSFKSNLLTWYDNVIRDQMEEALFDFNEDRIERDIKQYMDAVTCDLGTKRKCPYTDTDEEIIITEDFFRGIESRLFNEKMDYKKRKAFRERVLKEYTTNAYAQEMVVQEKDITETSLFRSLRDKYAANIKENVLLPLYENENYKRAVVDFDDEEKFKIYDKRVREDVIRMLKKLQKKFGYTEEGAREISVYVIENVL